MPEPLPDELDEDDLWSLVGTTEHERLDFGVSAKKDLRETFVAMAMTDGGRVLLGVDDARRLVGCTLDQRTLDEIGRAAHEVDVEITYKSVRVAAVPVVDILVPAVRDRVVTTPNGRILRRVGSSSMPLVGAAVGRFVADRVGPAAEDVVLPGVTVDDLDLAAVNEVLETLGRPRVRRAGCLRALQDLGVVPPLSTGINRAALVLFGRQPRATVPGYRVQLVRRDGLRPAATAASERRDVSGPLAHVAREVSAWVLSAAGAREVVLGLERRQIDRLPELAVREALLNALAHRDLSLTGATIDVTLWDDAVEIRSPGGLPGHITAENMRQEHFSRNPRVMGVLKGLRLVEEYGEGVGRIYEAMEQRLLPEPEYVVSDASVAITLLDRSPLSLEDQVWLSALGPLALTADERHALALVRRRGEIARRHLVQARPSVTDAGAVLSGLVTKGLLVRSGQAGGARYSMSAELVARAGAGGVQERQRQRELLEAELRRRGELSTADAAHLLDEPVATARAILGDLVRAGRARRTGRTRGTRYLPT